MVGGTSPTNDWLQFNGDPQHSGSELRVLRDASELEVAGPIGFGLSDEVQKILEGVEGIHFIYFTNKDVVRHKLVQQIIKAYERHEGQHGQQE